MSLATDNDLLSLFSGGQFVEEDIEDEVLACFSGGQFGIAVEAGAIITPIPARASPSVTGGGGGGSGLRLKVAASQPWWWEEEQAAPSRRFVMPIPGSPEPWVNSMQGFENQLGTPAQGPAQGPAQAPAYASAYVPTPVSQASKWSFDLKSAVIGGVVGVVGVTVFFVARRAFQAWRESIEESVLDRLEKGDR